MRDNTLQVPMPLDLRREVKEEAQRKMISEAALARIALRRYLDMVKHLKS
jgi:hypothetical protein